MCLYVKSTSLKVILYLGVIYKSYLTIKNTILFILGKCATLTEKENPNWVPTLNLGYISSSSRKKNPSLNRFKRFEKRNNASNDIIEPCNTAFGPKREIYKVISLYRWLKYPI